MKNTSHSSTTWQADQAATRIRRLFEIVNDSSDLTYQAIFTETFEADFALSNDIYSESSCDDQAAKSSTSAGLDGALVSVKDLIDVKGYVSKAGTRFLASAPPAQQDATVVQQLKQAGAHILGHTNMTELAYSGLGLNPHYGTPLNHLDPTRIPGGSSSGAAISVASGLVDIGIGSDTGGSLRIPAAFNGLVGFKPTQSSVSRAGCLPLSDALDSIGPIANSVAICERVWQTIRQPSVDAQHSTERSSKRDSSDVADTAATAEALLIANNFGFTELDEVVQRGFTALKDFLLKSLSIPINQTPLDCLESYQQLPVWQFSAVESQAHYQHAYQQQRDLIDPRVASRMARADALTAVEYQSLLQQRQRFIEAFTATLGQRLLLLPTVAILPPTFEACAKDDDYNRLNMLALRNTTLANVADGCSIALPYYFENACLSLMLIGANGKDQMLLDTAKVIETLLAKFSHSPN